MLPNDPILYGATLPYGEFPIQPQFATPFTSPHPQFMTPWQQQVPWQDATKYTPQSFGFSPYQHYQAFQQLPMLQRPPMTPFFQPFPFTQGFNQPFPFPQGFNQPFPFTQGFNQTFAQPFPFPQGVNQPFPFTQGVNQAFAQPFPFPQGANQPFNMNMPICNWQRPFNW